MLHSLTSGLSRGGPLVWHAYHLTWHLATAVYGRIKGLHLCRKAIKSRLKTSHDTSHYQHTHGENSLPAISWCLHQRCQELSKQLQWEILVTCSFSLSTMTSASRCKSLSTTTISNHMRKWWYSVQWYNTLSSDEKRKKGVRNKCHKDYTYSEHVPQIILTMMRITV
jgi:hypothetical protein